MRIVLLRGASSDLVWFRRYYGTVFPEGAERGTRHFREALERVADMPFVDRQIPDRPTRVYPVPRTPFLLVYRIAGDRVEVLRVWDTRQERVEGWSGENG